jgi:hypothetical protein
VSGRGDPKAFLSDWKTGSTYEMTYEEVGLIVRGSDQVILESDPYHRLAYSWHTITPEWATVVGMDEATAAIWRAEPRSKVAFDIEDVGHGAARLTVTHDGFVPGSAVLPAISGASGFSVGDFGERQFASGDLSSVATMVRWKIPTSIVTYSASAHHGK